MGLSLNPLKKLWDQVNVLDNGRTWSNPNPTSNRSVAQQVQNNPIVRFATPVAQMAKGFGQGVGHVATTPIEAARALTAQFTGNREAQLAAQRRAALGGEFVAGALQGIPRGIYQLGSSINPAGGDVYQREHTFTGLPSILFGDQPIPTMQRQFKQSQAEHGGAYAGGEAALTSIFAALGGKGTFKGVKNVVKPTPSKYTLSGRTGSSVLDDGVMSGVDDLRQTNIPVRDIGTGAQRVSVRRDIPITQIDESSRIPVSFKKSTKIPVRQAPSADELQTRFNVESAKIEKGLRSELKAVESSKKGPIVKARMAQEVQNKYDVMHSQLVDQFNQSAIPKKIPVKIDNTPTPPAQPTVRGKLSKEGTSRIYENLKGKRVPIKVSYRNSKGQKIKVKTARAQEFKQAIKDQASVDLGLEQGMQGNVSTVDKVTRSVTSNLNKLDTRLGASVSNRRELGEIASARAKSRLTATKGLSREEQANMARVLKGTEQPMNDKVAAAAAQIRQELDRVYALGSKVGVEFPGYRQNYFPQIHDPKQFKIGTVESDAAIRHLIKTGQAKTEAEAIGLLKQQRNFSKVSPYKNLTERRTLDLPGYSESTAAIHQYLDRAYATIAHTSVFGKGDVKLNAMLNDIRKTQGDQAYKDAIALYNRASGLDRGSDAAQKISQALTTFQGATKLGTSSIGNVTQMTNTAIAGGVGKTARYAIPAFRKKADKLFVEKTGVADEQVAHEALFGEQGLSGKARNFTAPGFEQIEKNNRASAALVGRDVANRLAKKAAKGDAKAAAKLKKDFGLETVDGKLSELDQIKAARVFVARTQFRTQAQDLPAWASTNWGRVVSQFKRYPYKQSQFLWKEVMKPALQGDVMPLARWLAVGVPVALGANEIRDKVRLGNFEPGVMDTINTALGGELISGTINQLTPNSKDSNAYLAKAVKSLGGPTVSDTVKAVQAGFDASQGDFKNAGRFGLTHIPVVGTPLSNATLPYEGNKAPEPGTPGENKAKAKQELADYRKNVEEGKGGDYGLYKMADGRYVYNIGDEVKTTSDIKTARKAIAKDSLANSDNQSKMIGDTYYYKDSDGDVRSMPKALHEFNVSNQQNQLAMDKAYRAGDIKAWADAADKQYNALEAKKALYNPDTESDKIDAITNQQQDLLYKLEGYLTKGIGGGRRKNDPFANPENFRIAVNPSKRNFRTTRINIRAGTSSAPIRARVAVKPKVALSKSKV